MKRRILLVDDEVAVLLTLKTVLEISGFDVDTATSAREGKSRIRHREYEMVITDMRMEGERAGEEVIEAARNATYRPAIALLTAFPVDEGALDNMGADQMLVKPMHTRQLLQQLESLFASHHGTQAPGKEAAEEPSKATQAAPSGETQTKRAPAKKVVAKKAVTKKPVAPAAKKAVAKKAMPAKPAAKKAVAKKPAAPAVKKSAVKKASAAKTPAKKQTAKR